MIYHDYQSILYVLYISWYQTQFVTWCSCWLSAGRLWRRLGRTGRCPQYRLCMEGQPRLFHLRQELLLQHLDHSVRYLHSAVLGLWVRYDHFLDGVVHYPLPAIVLNHHGLPAEVLRHLHHVLPGANMWNVWISIQSNHRIQNINPKNILTGVSTVSDDGLMWIISNPIKMYTHL